MRRKRYNVLVSTQRFIFLSHSLESSSYGSSSRNGPFVYKNRRETKTRNARNDRTFRSPLAVALSLRKLVSRLFPRIAKFLTARSRKTLRRCAVDFHATFPVHGVQTKYIHVRIYTRHSKKISASINVVCMWGTRSHAHRHGCVFTRDTRFDGMLTQVALCMYKDTRGDAHVYRDSSNVGRSREC